MAEPDPVARSYDLTDVRPAGPGGRARGWAGRAGRAARAAGAGRSGRAGRGVTSADPDAGTVRRLLVAVNGLYDKAVDAVLATPHAVADQGHALRLLNDRARDGDAVAEQVAKVALLATPVLRRIQTARRLTQVPGARRLPFVMSVTTVAGVGAALTRGVRDVQVLGSYVASRLRQASGGVEPDPELVKRLTVQLYLSPGTPARLDQRVGPARLVRRWLLRGALGRDSRRGVEKAVSSIARLDAPGVLAAWRTHGPGRGA